MFPLDTIRPAAPSGKPRDPDTVVSRADLWSLIDAIRKGVDGLEGKEALSRAGRIISVWCAGRCRIDARFASSHWKRDLLSLARAFLALGKGKIAPKWRTPFKVFKLKGNTKLPFATFSTLPIVTCPGAGECADWCYSFTAWRYPAAFARQLQNTPCCSGSRPNSSGASLRDYPPTLRSVSTLTETSTAPPPLPSGMSC